MRMHDNSRGNGMHPIKEGVDILLMLANRNNFWKQKFNIGRIVIFALSVLRSCRPTPACVERSTSGWWFLQNPDESFSAIFTLAYLMEIVKIEISPDPKLSEYNMLCSMSWVRCSTHPLLSREWWLKCSHVQCCEKANLRHQIKCCCLEFSMDNKSYYDQLINNMNTILQDHLFFIRAADQIIFLTS